MSTKNPIMVTGGAGFIGSHVSEYLVTNGFQVVVVDDLSLGSLNNLPTDKNIIFEKCDLTQHRKIALIIARYKPVLIYHLAAWAHEGLSQFIPTRITQTNYNSFLNLIVPAINHGLKKIVVCSSMSVYGDQKPPFAETLPRKPVDIYGIAKAAMENATEVLSQVYGFKYVIVRPHNVYGPGQSLSDPYRNVVAIFINRLLINKPFYIYGDGNQKRAFTYIDDLTSYLVKTGLDNKIVNQIYNIGPRKEYSLNALAKIILKEYGSNLKPVYLPRRPAEVDYAYCTSKKAEADLGFRSTTDLTSGIRTTIAWAKKVGFQKPKYLSQMEINSDILPKTWKKHLI